MSYIESHQELGRHPKTRRMARMLSVSLPCAVGHLQFLWWWAMDYAEDGDLTKFDVFDIADAAGWEGDPEAFLSALIGCGIGSGSGFLDSGDDGTLRLHDWNEYGGKLFIERKKNATKQARYRDQKQGIVTDPDVLPSRNRNVTVTSPVTLKERRGEESVVEKKMPTASPAREETPALSREIPTSDVALIAHGAMFDPSSPLPVSVENFLSYTPNPEQFRRRLLLELEGRELHSAERYALRLLRTWKESGLPPLPTPKQRRLTHDEAVTETRQALTELLTVGDGFE